MTMSDASTDARAEEISNFAVFRGSPLPSSKERYSSTIPEQNAQFCLGLRRSTLYEIANAIDAPESESVTEWRGKRGALAVGSFGGSHSLDRWSAIV
jgi:hypothetical protein